MQIDVRGLIGLSGQQREMDVFVQVPALEGHGEAVLFAPARLHLVLTSTPGGILATGQVETTAKLTCGRCLASFEQPLCGQLEHLFVSEAPADAGAREHRAIHAGEVAEGDAGESPEPDDGPDVSPIIDGTIDVGPLVREVLALALPMKPLCRPDCKGLCPVCGHPLNDGPCGCKIEEVDPRLAVLGSLLKGQGPEHEDEPGDRRKPPKEQD